METPCETPQECAAVGQCETPDNAHGRWHKTEATRHTKAMDGHCVVPVYLHYVYV